MTLNKDINERVVMDKQKSFTIMSYDDNFDEEFTIDETTLNSDTELLKLAYRNEIVSSLDTRLFLDCT